MSKVAAKAKAKSSSSSPALRTRSRAAARGRVRSASRSPSPRAKLAAQATTIFATIESGSGLLALEDVLNVLCHLNEDMTREDALTLVQASGHLDHDQVDYKRFIEFLLYPDQKSHPQDPHHNASSDGQGNASKPSPVFTEVLTLSGKIISALDVNYIGELRKSVAAELGVAEEKVKFLCDDRILADDEALVSSCLGHPITAFVSEPSIEDVMNAICISDINATEVHPPGGTALHAVALLGNRTFMELVLGDKRFTKLNDKNMYRRTALQVAVESGHTECIKALLSDSRINRDGAFQSAMYSDRADVVEVLLADSNWSERHITQALHDALVHECKPLVHVLLAHPHASLNMRTDSGATFLHIAGQHGDTHAVRMLLGDDRFVEVDAVDRHGRTALHRTAAAMQDYCETILAILESRRFTQWSLQDNQGYDALHMAEENRCWKSAHILKAHAEKFGKSWAPDRATPCKAYYQDPEPAVHPDRLIELDKIDALLRKQARKQGRTHVIATTPPKRSDGR